MTQKVGGIEFDVDVDSSGVSSASSNIQSDLKKVEANFNAVDASAKNAGVGMAKSTEQGAKGMRNLRNAAGQLGFQLQDIAVQAQMGTNAFVILGQQGSQIASIFGPTGAIVGGVLAVGAAIASVMVPSMMDGSDATEELSDKLKELSKTNELTINQQKFLKQVEAEEEREKQKKIKALQDERKELLANSETGDWYQKTVLGAANANQGFVSFVASKLIPTLTDEQKKLVEVNAQLDVLEGKTGAAKIDPQENLDALKFYSKRLEYIQQSLNMEGDIIAAANARQFAIMQEGGNQQLALLEERLAAQRARKQFEKERDLAGFEEERVNILENEKLTAEQKALLVDELNELEKQRKEQHQNELTNIERDAANARQKIAEQEAQAKMATLSSIFGNLSSLMNTESKKMFEIGKAAATAGAIVDGIAAVQGAYKQGAKIGGPALGAAFAASAAVATLANIKQIQSTQYGSKSTGQSYQGGQVVNNTQQQPQQVTQRNISISLAGSGSFTGGDIRGLINSINEELGDGATLSIAGG